MKTKSASRSAFFNPRLLIGFVLCSVGLLLPLAGLTKSVTGTIATAGAVNPVPLISQPLVPDAVAPGGAGFTLTMNGTGFVSGSVVNWNGSARATTFVSNSQLTVSILVSDIAIASTASVTVVNPSPGGGTSNVEFFPITLASFSITLSRSDFPLSPGPAGVAAGDFNGDGKLDLAVANYGGNTVSILLGNGDGTFQTHVEYATGAAPDSPVVGDFNGDGLLDVAVRSQNSNEVSLLLGNGDGTFQTVANFAAGSGAGSMAAGDLNGDGNLDLVSTSAGENMVYILLGKGDGTFQRAVAYPTGSFPGGIAVGDLNEDGKLDLAVNDVFGDAVSILLGNGDGTFQPHVDYATGTHPNWINVADLNADGALDLVVPNAFSNTVSILLGNGNGTFQPRVDYPAGTAGRSSVADLNGDGKVDLAVTVAPGVVLLLLGNGDGTFQLPISYATGAGGLAAAVGDFNGDGRLDLGATNINDNSISVLLQATTVTQECVPPPAGLVSWWSGDKTAEDVQGINPGVLKNGASFRPGQVGPGFLFDGVDDVVTIPNSASLSQTRITLDAWIYPTGNAGTLRHLMSKDNNPVAREFILGMEDQANRFNCFVQLPTGEVVVTGTTTAQLNTWYHVAMTHDGLKLRLYVNGVLEGSLDAVGDVVPTSNPLGIGGNIRGAFFQGIIDEAQIFDRALTDAEILAIYQAGADGQCKPDIFVASIDPSYTVSGHGFRISTSIVIQDVNGIGISGATVQLGVILPSGSALTFPLKTDATGQADVSFTVADSGLYQFKVRNVNHPTREYDPSLNIETSDRLLIP